MDNATICSRFSNIKLLMSIGSQKPAKIKRLASKDFKITFNLIQDFVGFLYKTKLITAIVKHLYKLYIPFAHSKEKGS